MNTKTHYYNPTEVVHTALDNACNSNRFNTFAKVYRKTLDKYFSADMSNGYRGGMSFREWACYNVGDDDFSFRVEEVKAFEALAIAKGLIAEGTGNIER